MQRFYVHFPLSIDITLTDNALLNQITRVLRMKEWEHIILFDGDGSETEYEIIKIEKKSIRLRWIKKNFPQTEAKKSVTLYQALPNKYEKIEYILQKGVEIGIKKFVFFRSDFSQKLLITPAKITRFLTIAQEAVEQCWWVSLPIVEFIDKIALSKWGSHTLVLDTIGRNYSFSEFWSVQDIVFFVGPEGGWSEAEREKMKDYGYIFARFWERVLRTETASSVVAFWFFHI